MRINPNYRPSIDSSASDDAPDADYITSIVKYIQTNFLNKVGIPPAFVYCKDTEIKFVQVPEDLLSSEKGKDELAFLMSSAVKAFEPESHCFISESWIYKMQDYENQEEAFKALNAFKAGSKTTGIEREEVVTFNFNKINPDKSVDRWLGTMSFQRDESDMISKFNPIKWLKNGADKKLEGRFVV